MSKLIVETEINGIPDCCGLCDPLFMVVCATKHDQTIDKMMLRVGRPSWCPIKSILPEQHGDWVSVKDRLPKEDTDVLISYRYKEGEGDTSHVDIDITSYGQMYFGGREVAGKKYWRAPFEYFLSNYEVIAWMPLPEPYREEQNDEIDRR